MILLTYVPNRETIVITHERVQLFFLHMLEAYKMRLLNYEIALIWNKGMLCTRRSRLLSSSFIRKVYKRIDAFTRSNTCTTVRYASLFLLQEIFTFFAIYNLSQLPVLNMSITI